MRTFTEEELRQAIVDAFDEGVARGASWRLAGDLPSLEVRRAIASNDCLDILNKAIRNQSVKQS
jgi:hypothetical protein